MKTKELILKKVSQKGFARTSDIVRFAGISRQTVAQHFRELIAQRKLLKIGVTRNARYVPFTKDRLQALHKQSPSFQRRYRTRGLQEDRVLDEADLRMRLEKLLSNQAAKIVRYTFTEMLNNAIEHSRSRHVKVFLHCRQGEFQFLVEDAGVGVFENMRRKFCFKDHFEAVGHLLKGKLTTDPKHHSGQGIFFTSKIADRFVLQSAKLKLVVDNALVDTFLEDTRFFKGTRVEFKLKQRSKKNLKALFDNYTNDDYEFDKTKVRVSLSRHEGEYISRSQARRLMFGLEKFRRVVLDFKKVVAIGQGFSDEVFRVFHEAHPVIQIEVQNAAPSVEFLIKRARRDTLRSQ